MLYVQDLSLASTRPMTRHHLAGRVAVVPLHGIINGQSSKSVPAFATKWN